jgi:hypothetical protein
MGRVTKNGHGAVVLLAAVYPEGKDAHANSVSATGPKLSARWWDHSEPQVTGPTHPLKRFGYDCGGRRHHRGIVTLRRLGELYEEALTGRVSKIYI